MLKKCLTMMGLATIMALGTSACSDENEVVTPDFPEVVTMNTQANTEQTFGFTANMDWQLSSSATWCTFPEVGEKAQTISGGAGHHIVKLHISDENLKFGQTTKAVLSLMMGGISQTVAEIIRASKEYELKMYDMDGKEISSLAIGVDGSLEFAIEANFEFAATSYPEWIGEVTFSSNSEVQGRKNMVAIVKEGYEKNSQDQGTVVFANQMGTVSFPMPVTYSGMEPTKIIIESKDVERGSFFNWEVSMDGKTFSRHNDLTAETDVVNDKMTFHVTAVNDGYTPVFMEEYEGEYYFDASEWIHLSKEGETAILTVDESDRVRKGYVLLFPDAVYNDIKDDLAGNIIESDGTVKYEYEQKYFLMAFTQKDNSEEGFTVLQMGYLDIICKPETDTNVVEFLQSETSVGADDIYFITVGASAPLTVNPLLTIDEWSSENSNFCYAITLSGTRIDDSVLGGFEGSLSENGEHYLVSFKTPSLFDEPIAIVFKGTDFLNKKILIVKPE